MFGGFGTMAFFSSKTYREDLREIANNVVNCEQLKNKKILVTGANGLIASYIVDTLLWLDDNWQYNTEIYVLARSKEKIANRFFEHYHDPHLHVIVQDVTNPILCDSCIFDYVVHAACSAHPLAYSKTPVEIIRANINGTENILNYLQKNKGKLLFISSSEVYGENYDNDVLREDMYGYININNPRSCYSESKRAAETLCVSYSHEFGVESCFVRPGFIFGPAITADNSRADAQFLRNALKGEDIVLKSAGTQYRSYEYVSDAVSGIVTVLINGKNENAYNIASPISTATIRQFAECIAKTAGISVVFENPDEIEKAGYSVISRCILDSGKLMSLGWKPSVTLEEGINRMIAISKEVCEMA